MFGLDKQRSYNSYQAGAEMTDVPTLNNDLAFTLPRDHYVSEEHFAKERAAIFNADWVYAGHVSQIPRKGDYVKIDYAGEEVVVVRGADDAVYANLNVCRHRGYRLCKEKAGHVSAFVCGYHQWRYALDGALEKAPMSRDGDTFDYADYGLQTAKVMVWNSLIFVHLSEGDVATLTDRLEAFAPVAAQFNPAGTTLVHEEVYEIDGNWKVVVDNAMECYHCAATHSRSLCTVIDVPRLMNDLTDWLAVEGDQSANLGLGGMHVKPGAKTMSPDGTLICKKLLGTCTAADADAGITGGIMLIPNFMYAAFYVDHWWTISIRPRSSRRTQLLYSFFVRSDAEAGKDYDLNKLIAVGHNTQLEDNVLIERTQAGIESLRYQPGPLAPYAEAGLIDFLTRYRALMD